MKKIVKFFKLNLRKEGKVAIERRELENKAIEGAKKAVKEYRRVFERLAEYDRV